MGWNAPAVGTSRKYVALIEQERRTEIESLLGGRTGPNAAEQAQLPEKPPSPESRLLPISSAEKANYFRLDEFSHRTGWRLSADWLQNRRIWPSVTYSLGRGPETDFDALAQRGSNPVQHTQRVPFVIRILQARDDRLPGSNPLGQFGLGKTGLVAGCINELGHSRIDPRLLGKPPQFGSFSGHLIQNGQGIGRLLSFSFRSHKTEPRAQCGRGSWTMPSVWCSGLRGASSLPELRHRLPERGQRVFRA